MTSRYWREPAAFLAASFDLDAMTADPGRTSHWHVPTETTAGLCEHLASWTAPGGSRIVVRRDVFSFEVTEGSTVAGMLAVRRNRHRHGRRPPLRRRGTNGPVGRSQPRW